MDRNFAATLGGISFLWHGSCFIMANGRGLRPYFGKRMGIMKAVRFWVSAVLLILATMMISGPVWGEEYKIAVVKEEGFSSQEFARVVNYMAKRGVAVTIVEAPTYEDVAAMVAAGKADAMFTGPGIPGSMFVIHRLKVKESFAGFRAEGSKFAAKTSTVVNR